jgi:hypothetical protein
LTVGLLVNIDEDKPTDRAGAFTVAIRSLSGSGVFDLSALMDSVPGELPAFFLEKNLK